MITGITDVARWCVGRIMVLTGGVEDILGDLSSDTGGTGSTALAPMTDKIKEIGGGGYKIAFMIACFVFVIGLIMFFVKMFTANSQERSFMKWDIVWKAAAIACAFGAIAIVTMLANFGGQIFASGS